MINQVRLNRDMWGRWSGEAIIQIISHLHNKAIKTYLKLN